MSTPLTRHRPLSGLSRPIIDLRNTDLPVPDGPSITETSPGGRVNVTSCQIFCLPKDLVRPSTITSAPTRTSSISVVDLRNEARRRNGRRLAWPVTACLYGLELGNQPVAADAPHGDAQAGSLDQWWGLGFCRGLLVDVQ